jgi:RNA polymerase sigma factor (sigma-70 family)
MEPSGSRAKDWPKDKSNFWPNDDNEFTDSLIQYTARKYCRRAFLSLNDYDDLVQHLAIHLWTKIRFFNPQRGTWRDFAVTVAKNEAIKFVRRQWSASRDIRRNRSVDQCLLPANDSTFEQTNLAIDLAEKIAKLPPHLQELLRLRKSHSLGAVARLLGVPRQTLNGWVRQINRRFEKTGLKKYLEN